MAHGWNGTDLKHQIRRYTRLPGDDVIVPKSLLVAILEEFDRLHDERPVVRRPSCPKCGSPACQCAE